MNTDPSKPITHDINVFQVGDTVTVPSAPEYVNVKISRISDGGVTVNGQKCPPETVISGKSPAYLVRRNGDTTPLVVEGDTESVAHRAPRGTYTEKLKNIVTTETPFTIKNIAELNDIPINYAAAWVKDNCLEVGLATKAEGQRGKAAMTYIKA